LKEYEELNKNENKRKLKKKNIEKKLGSDMALKPNSLEDSQQLLFNKNK
jgi:hypothetical protein